MANASYDSANTSALILELSMDTGYHYSLLNGANLKVILPLTYGLPLLVFYSVVVFVLFRRLKSPFYRFFAIAGVTDIVAWILTFILRRARFSPMFFGFYEALPEEGFFVTFALFWLYHNNYSQMLATLFLTATRFTAVILPFKHRKIWNVLTYVGHALIAFLPLGFSWCLWAGNVKIRPDNPDDYWSGYRWDITVLPFKTPGGLINAFIGVAYGVPVVSMNIAIFYKLRTLGANRMSREDTRDEEKKLLALTTIIIAYFVVNVVVSIIFYVAKNMLPSGTVDLLFSIQSFMLDVHVLSAPCLLLLMSTAARQELRRFLGWKQSPVPWAPPSSVYPTLTAGS